MPPNLQTEEVDSNDAVASEPTVESTKTAPARRRGDFDYHISINGMSGAADYRWSGAAVIQKNSTSIVHLGFRGEAWGETTLKVNGESKILELVGRPPSFGRRPNFRAIDVRYRAMDGLLKICSTSPYEMDLDSTFDALQRSYSDENEKYYSAPEKTKHPVLAMYAEYNFKNAQLASNMKVVSFLLLVDETQFEHLCDDHQVRSAKDSEEQFRQEIAKLQEKYGAEKIRFYVVSKDDKEEEVMKDILVKMCEDIENQNGIRFESITSPETLNPKFEQLDKKLPSLVAAPL